MAFEASSVGKVIVKLDIGVLSAPKFSTATAAFVVLLYIKAPLVVKFAGFQVTVLKDKYAVYPELVGGITVKV
jgi:hypothetical protein